MSFEWEIGVTDYVYPFEIGILDEEEPSCVDVNETWREPSLELDKYERRVVTHRDARWN